MRDFHEKVIGSFADLFVTYCSTYPYRGITESLTKRPVTPSERQRWALYRYGLYRELFSCAPGLNSGRSASQLDVHFRYSMWENEQIYCIIDFLRRQLRGRSFRRHCTINTVHAYDGTALSSIAEANEDTTRATDWWKVNKRASMIEIRLGAVKFKWWRDPISMNDSIGPSHKQVELLIARSLAWVEDVLNAPSYKILSRQLELQVFSFDDTRHIYIGNFIDRLYRRNWWFQTRHLLQHAATY